MKDDGDEKDEQSDLWMCDYRGTDRGEVSQSGGTRHVSHQASGLN